MILSYNFCHCNQNLNYLLVSDSPIKLERKKKQLNPNNPIFISLSKYLKNFTLHFLRFVKFSSKNQNLIKYLSLLSLQLLQILASEYLFSMWSGYSGQITSNIYLSLLFVCVSPVSNKASFPIAQARGSSNGWYDLVCE